MNMQTKGIETVCGPWPGLCRLCVLNQQSSVCSYFSEVCWNMTNSHIVSTISEDAMVRNVLLNHVNHVCFWHSICVCLSVCLSLTHAHIQTHT